MTPGLQHLVRQVHGSPVMLAYAFMGAGPLALEWLRDVDESSRTVLEAHDWRASRGVLGPVSGSPSNGTPTVDHAAVPDAAGELALESYRRARDLAPGGVAAVGVGCAARVANDAAPDALRACVVVHGALGRHVLTLAVRHVERERRELELLVSTVVVHAIATGCGVLHRGRPALRPGETLEERFEPARRLAEVLGGQRTHVVLTRAGELEAGVPRLVGGIAIVSGSFNPLHEGHLGLAAAAQRHLQLPTVFELARRTVTKATLEPLELYERATQFYGRATLVITDAARFSEKAAIYPGSVFVLGADTVARMVSRRCPDDHGLRVAMSGVRINRCRFLVAGRQRLAGGTAPARVERGADAPEATIEVGSAPFVTLADLDVPPRYADLFEALPEEVFRSDVSSSHIRDRSGPSPLDL